MVAAVDIPPTRWSIRPATAEDAYTLADIVIEATKAQGRWPTMTPREEADWRDGFADWSRQTVQVAEPTGTLSVIEIGGQAIGRLRVLRDMVNEADPSPARRIQLAGMQLIPTMQGQGIGTAVVRDLQHEAEREGVTLDISVEKDNPRARGLYERLGCVLIGESDDEYLLRWASAGPA